MKIYLRKNERFLGESMLELLPIIREVDQFEYDKPLKLDKKYLDLLWIEVAETEDVNVFDVYAEYEEAEKIHLPLTHGLLVTGDVVEKSGKYIILGDHIQNGIIDFGDVPADFNIFADDDLWKKGYHSVDEQLPSIKSDSQYGRNRSEKTKDDDCVSKWISKLTDEGVGEGKRWKNHKQVVAVAHSKCGLSKKSEVVDDFDYYNEMPIAVPVLNESPPQDEPYSPYSEHYTFTYEYDNDWEWAEDYVFQKFEDINIYDLKVHPDFALHPEDVKNGSPRVRKDTLYYYAVETTEMRPFIVSPNYNLIDGHHRLYAIMDKKQRNIRVAIVLPRHHFEEKDGLKARGENPRAPKGGATINGKFYSGGRFIPAKEFYGKEKVLERVKKEANKSEFQNHNIEHVLNPENYLYPKDSYSDDNKIKSFLGLSVPSTEKNVNKYVEILKIGYIKPNQIKSWEHTKVHYLKEDQEIEDYVWEMDPLICEIKNNKIVLIEEGNHRLNTLNEFGSDVPVVVVKNMRNGYKLRFRDFSGIVFQQEDKEKEIKPKAGESAERFSLFEIVKEIDDDQVNHDEDIDKIVYSMGDKEIDSREELEDLITSSGFRLEDFDFEEKEDEIHVTKKEVLSSKEETTTYEDVIASPKFKAQFVESQHPRDHGKFTKKSPQVNQLLGILPEWEKALRGTSASPVSLDFIEKYFEHDFESDINVDNWDKEEVFDEFTDLSQLCLDLDSAYEEAIVPSKKRKITELQIMYTEVREDMVKGYAKVIEVLESVATKSDLTQDEMIEIIKELMDLDLPTVKELKQRQEKLKRPAQEWI